MSEHSFIKDSIHFNQTISSADHDGYYEGQFLLATPTMVGDAFSNAVVYIFAHNAGGAMGIIINKPLDSVHYVSLFQQLGLDVSSESSDLPVYHGGPVEENRGFIIHSNDYSSDDTLDHECGISVTASMTILRDISEGKGPKEALLTIGYAGWGAGQLEAEIESNSWLTVPATASMVFECDDDAKHGMAAKSIGIDMQRFSLFAGHA